MLESFLSLAVSLVSFFHHGDLVPVSNNRRISLLCCLLSLFAVSSLVCFAVGLPFKLLLLYRGLSSFCYVVFSYCCYAPVTVGFKSSPSVVLGVKIKIRE